MGHRLYLAGASVFRPDALQFGRGLVAICARHGCHGIYPITAEHELVLDQNNPRENGLKVFQMNIEKIRSADGLIADMSPFRGPGMDGGTAFEMGAAYMCGKPIVGYGPDQTFRDKVICWCKTISPTWTPSRDPRTNLIYDHIGMSIDDFGGVENVMMDYSIDQYACGFEEAVIAMREILEAKATT